MGSMREQKLFRWRAILGEFIELVPSRAMQVPEN